MELYIYKYYHCYIILKKQIYYDYTLYGNRINHSNHMLCLYDYHYLFDKKYIKNKMELTYIKISNNTIIIYSNINDYNICINNNIYKYVEKLDEELKYDLLNKIGYY